MSFRARARVCVCVCVLGERLITFHGCATKKREQVTLHTAHVMIESEFVSLWLSHGSWSLKKAYVTFS